MPEKSKLSPPAYRHVRLSYWDPKCLTMAVTAWLMYNIYYPCDRYTLESP